MNLPSAKCESCKHYKGGKVIGGNPSMDNFIEGEFLPTCKAFPNGIPEVINDGKNQHTKPLPNQRNKIVFEPNR